VIPSSASARRLIGDEARHQIEPPAPIERGEHHRGEPKRMADRQHRVHAISGSELADLGAARGDEQEAVVGQHHAFGRARGAGRVDQRGHLARRVVRHRLRHSARVGRDPQAARPEHRVVARAMTLGVGGRLGRDGCGEQKGARAAMREDRVHLAGRQPGVERHGPGAQPRRSQDRGDRPDAVLQHDRDPIASPHAERAKACGEPIDRAVERRVGEGHEAVCHRGPLGRRARPMAHRLVKPAEEVARQRAASRSHLRRGGGHGWDQPAASRSISRAMISCWICEVPS
jgi:hypothetical protein